MKKYLFIIPALLFGYLSPTVASDLISIAPENAKVYIISPKDGQTVPEKFMVQFGLSGMGVAPAGVNHDNTGHHHLLIDTDINTLDFSKPLPATKQVIHFGGGQTETWLELAPGEHTLELVLGNYLHIPHNPPVVSKKITVMVAELK